MYIDVELLDIGMNIKTEEYLRIPRDIAVVVEKLPPEERVRVVHLEVSFLADKVQGYRVRYLNNGESFEDNAGKFLALDLIELLHGKQKNWAGQDLNL